MNLVQRHNYQILFAILLRILHVNQIYLKDVLRSKFIFTEKIAVSSFCTLTFCIQYLKIINFSCAYYYWLNIYIYQLGDKICRPGYIDPASDPPCVKRFDHCATFNCQNGGSHDPKPHLQTCDCICPPGTTGIYNNFIKF